MPRLHFLMLIASLLCMAVGGPLAAADQPARRPNVILVLADDLGYGDLHCYGHPRFETPNLDQLAREGVRMTQFYVPVPYCAPTRASLMTGRYPPRCGLTRNPVPSKDPVVKHLGDVGLPLTEITLGNLFHDAGYATICIGKWHLGHQPRFYPTRRGFDEYLGILYSNDMHPVELFDGEKRIEYPVVQATLTRRYTDRAIDFMERHRDRPFFIYLPHAMPHKPLAASEEFYQKTGNGLYADVIAELDHEIGRLFQRLKELGLDKDTLVIFTSDNGPWYGGSTGGLRGMKGRTWEGGIRVPLIARWPGKIPKGRVCHEPAIMMDLFVTCCKATGIPLPKDRIYDGRDILPLWTADAPSPHEAIYGFRGNRLSTVRVGNWKLHVAPPGPRREKVWRADERWIDPRRPDGVRIIAPFEQAHPSQFPGVRTGDPFHGVALFDLTRDPAEQHDVAAEHPDVVEKLRRLADRFRSQLGGKAR